MDEQNSRGNQNDQQIDLTDTPLQPRPQFDTPLSVAPPTIQDSPRSKKIIYLTVGILVIAFLVAGLLWYFLLYDGKNPTDNSKNEATNTSAQSISEGILNQPDQLIYYRGNGASSPRALYARSLATNEEVHALTLPEKAYISDSVIRNNQVAIAVSQGGDSTDEASIYYSNDSGKSYSKIYTIPHDNKETSVLGPQITSLVFSTDGKALVASILRENVKQTDSGVDVASYENEVTEISLEEETTKVLFTSSTPGILLKGYNRDKQKIIYLASGCYNCEPYYTDIFSYDIATGAQNTLYHSNPVSQSVEVNNNFTKVLTLKPIGPYIDDKASFSLFTIDIATKAEEALKTIDNSIVRQIGYTPEDSPYFATNTEVQEVTKDGLTMLYKHTESSNDYFRTPWVLFAGTNGIIANIETSATVNNRQAITLTVLSSKPGDEKTTEIMRKDNVINDLTLIGVTRK